MSEVEILGEEEFKSLLAREGFSESAFESAQRWIERGDQALLYRNEDLSSRDLGLLKIVSYGSIMAQIEAEQHPVPPVTLPDIGGDINWRYQLFAIYRGQTTEDEIVTAFLQQGGDS